MRSYLSLRSSDTARFPCFVWLIVLPSFAKTPDTIVVFEECGSIDKKNVFHLLDVELPDHVPDYVKKIAVLCTRNFRVEVLLVTPLGNSVRRTLHLDVCPGMYRTSIGVR